MGGRRGAQGWGWGIERAAVASAGPGGAPRGCCGAEAEPPCRPQPRSRDAPSAPLPAPRGASEGGSTRCLAGGRRGEVRMRELPCPATSGSFAAVPEIEPASADSRLCTLTAKAAFSQFNFSLPSSTLDPSLERKTKPSPTITPPPPLPWLNGTAPNMPKHNRGTSPLAAKSERKVKRKQNQSTPFLNISWEFGKTAH